MGKKVLIAIYFLITIVPLCMGLGYSLFYSLGLIGLMNKGFTFAHWTKLWNSSDALGTLGYSLYLTLISLLLAIGLALLLSWKLVNKQPARWLYKSLFLPLTFPPLIAAFVWYHILSPAGVISRWVYHLGLTNGLEDFPRWVNDRYSIGILITHTFLIFPLFTLLFVTQARKERIKALLDTASTLGSTKSQFFKKIYVPVMLLKTRPLIWLYGIFLMGTYEVPLLLGQSSPRVITLFVTDKMTRFNLQDIPVGHAMVVVYSMIVLVVISLFVRQKNMTLL